MRAPERLRVNLGERSYEILVGAHLLGEAGALIEPHLTRKRTFVVTDENVAALHLEELTGSLEAAGIDSLTRVLPAGETSKALSHLEELVDWLLCNKAERSDQIIALGGGVIGDLVGFAAAVTLRGINFIQIPTSLLAQVDSSVGGKTGINCRWGKNLIGAFHQPSLVLADTTVLSTLPKRELLAGYAEVVKYGLIGDADFFQWLEGHGPALLDLEHDLMQQAVLTCCRMKAEIVAGDEREAGKRALLNLGHTFGHALEAEAGYSGLLLHGEAVSLGMVLAFDLSVQLGLCPARDGDRVRRHLGLVGLPTGAEHTPGLHWDPHRLIEHMSRDKKASGGSVTFVLVKGIGQAFLEKNVSPEVVLQQLTLAAA
ncbi:MAG: 3-dehydroquinate synthase [Kiloniellales bacterium]|nr:3-dehydroquinate synthase [Kiloniellales bacterium]